MNAFSLPRPLHFVPLPGVPAPWLAGARAPLPAWAPCNRGRGFHVGRLDPRERGAAGHGDRFAQKILGP
ncbi:AraC family transcriptional regulator, partial [Bordetella bronchiseptica]